MDRRTYVETAGALSVGALAGCTGLLEDGPEDVTEEFLVALLEGDAETQRELLHDEAIGFAPQEEPVGEYTIHEIRETSVSEFADEMGIPEEQEQSFQQDLENGVEEVGADEYAIVFFSVDTDEFGNEEGSLILVEDGSWLVYSAL